MSRRKVHAWMLMSKHHHSTFTRVRLKPLARIFHDSDKKLAKFPV